MSRIFYIVKKIDERLIQGVQVAVVQSFQLLPGLLSFHMTGSIHRHILVSILASLVCIILSLFIDQPTILLAINLRDSFGFYSTPLSEALIGKLGILNISALSLLAILVIGYLCALIRKNEINLGSVLKLGLASILAATTVLTTHFILIATVQFIFVMLIFWEVMGSLGAGRHRSCATFVSSQLISFLLIIASAAYIGRSGWMFGIGNAVLIIGLALRGGLYPFYSWFGESTKRSTITEGLMVLYQVSIWPQLIQQFEKIDQFFQRSFLILSIVMGFGLAALVVRIIHEDDKTSVSRLLPVIITTIILFSLLRRVI